MKRILILLVLASLLFGLVGCGSTPGGKETSAPTVKEMPERILEVGYSKKDITPEGSIPMDDGWSTETLDHLYAITVAFRDEEGKLFIHVVTDLSWGGMADAGVAVSYGVCDMVRAAAEKELGLSAEYITVSGTHNHSQVAYGSKEKAADDWRNQVLIPQIMASIREAMEDLSPAQMYIGRTKTQKLNFVRRYWLKDGSYYDGFTGNRDTEIDRHETQADEEVQLVKFVREGKRDILMVNWQCHATVAGSSGTKLSADFVGPLRDQVEAYLDVDCVFYQGAAGNLVGISRIAGEGAVSGGGWESAKKLGKGVAAFVADVYERDDFTKVETGLIRMERITVPGKVYKFDPAMLENAQKVVDYHETSGGNYETAEYASQFGIETIYHARSIIANSKLGDVKNYELNIISVGDVAFTTLPMEFFDTTGMQIKNGSPFKMTVMLGYSCSKGQYVPDIEAWGHGGYESYRTYYVPGTAEEAVSYYLESLNRLYPIRKGS